MSVALSCQSKMVLEPVYCPQSHTTDVVKNGRSAEGKQRYRCRMETPPTKVMVVRAEEAEMDEMWSFVQAKRRQRWLWHAIDYRAGDVLAYVLAPQKDRVLQALMEWLTPFGVQQFYTDSWGAYSRLLEPEHHRVGKTNIQGIERKHLILRPWIKRLARKTICFSKSFLMHDTVIGPFINRDEFGRAV